LSDLPGARQEALEVGRLLGVEPLLGKGRAPSACGLLHSTIAGCCMPLAMPFFRRGVDLQVRASCLQTMRVFSARDFKECEASRAHRDSQRLRVWTACHRQSATSCRAIAPSLLLCGASTVISTLWQVDDEAVASSDDQVSTKTCATPAWIIAAGSCRRPTRGVEGDRAG